MKADYLKNVADKIQKYSTYLGNKPWFAGNEVCNTMMMMYNNNNNNNNNNVGCSDNICGFSFL